MRTAVLRTLLQAALVGSLASPVAAQDVVRQGSTLPERLPKAKIGTDDDSVRPFIPNTRPQMGGNSSLRKPLLRSKAKTGTDDDSVRPVKP